jgi:hypothetical protein
LSHRERPTRRLGNDLVADHAALAGAQPVGRVPLRNVARISLRAEYPVTLLLFRWQRCDLLIAQRLLRKLLL